MIDFVFLEDMGRIADNIIRENPGSLKKRKDALCKKAFNVDVDLRLMPYGMNRQKTNKTFFSGKSQTIFWTIEWDFRESDIKLVTHKNSDSSVLKDLINFHVSNEDSQKAGDKSLMNYLNQTDFFVYLKLEDQPAYYPKYFLCDSSMTVGEALKHRTIFEYPTFAIHTYPIQ